MSVIYHYTSGAHLNKILETGKLIVSEWEKKNGVRPPALWLSLNPIWENTATKLVNDNGTVRRLTKSEQHDKFGLFRFVLGFNKSELCSWARYRHASNTPGNTYVAMENSGIELGSNPLEWYASFKDIPIVECISCEIWNGNKWINHINLQQDSTQ